MITLTELLERPSEDEIREQIVAYLSGLGFAAQSWQPGSWQLHIIQLCARVSASVASSVSDIAASGFITLAPSDEWAELIADRVYGVERTPATRAVGLMTLSSSPGAPSHALSDEILIADAPSDPAIVYRVQSVVSGNPALAPGSSEVVVVRAELAGASGNIAASSTLHMWTPLVGVTATNPALPGSSTWLTAPGTDAEDRDRLAERCMGQWHALSYGAGDGAYRTWALEADPSVTRVLVVTGPTEGSVRVVCATALGGISSTQADEIRAYIYGETDGVGRRPINDDVSVVAAIDDAVPVPWTVTVSSEYQSVTTESTVRAALDAYAASLPIGGVVIPPSTTGIAVAAEAIAAVMALPGVINVVGAGSDYPYLSREHVLVPSYSITMVYV